MKSILVTGGAGFIGSNLVKKLIEEGFEVIVLDNLITGKKENLPKDDRLTFIEGDILDYALLESLIKKANVVIHLAAMISVPDSIKHPEECFKINLEASKKIIDVCLKNNVVFMFASSAAVYGEDKSPIKSEESSSNPISPYGKSKLLVEEYCASLKDRGLRFVCFRNFNVYGPRQAIDSAYAAVIPKFIERALVNQELIIFGDGEQTRDFIFVSDVIDAFLQVIRKPDNFNDFFNLGSGKTVTISQLAKLIIAKTNSSSKITFLPARKGDIKHSTASIQKIKAKGWEPKTSLEKGLLKTINYYKKLLQD